MKKYIVLFVMLFALQSYAQKEKTVFELKPSQSMCMTGKGVGQDAAINPYINRNSIAIIENLSENNFTVRVQYKGDVVKTIVMEANKKTMVSLRKGFELYLDSDLEATAKLEFRDGVN
ncbi:hypothetical protein [Kordia jejudonensis]|uniref:hypothetical protein n=1 Tax=Kordia jejudonensis TaxID=1348245 RepID=UPI0006290909|nr:hypothetical protein [Kordia jejudonensis]